MKKFDCKIFSGLQKLRKAEWWKVIRITLIFITMGITQSFALGSYTLNNTDAIFNFNQVNQQHAVSGKVTDSSGQPLPGVTVVVKGTTQGTVTNADGDYTLTNIPEDATLVFSFVGMRTQEVNVRSQTVINVRMEEETIGLEEVVAVGYGTQKKVNLTGAISNLDFESEQFSSRALTNVSTALAGTVTGINVRQGSGLPGNDNATIRVRGIGSLNASQEPLVLIDGQVGNMDMLNPDEVASISVLKDAASAAIYGSRASNGVILVTTKSGSDTNGKVTFRYSGRVSSGEPTQMDDFISNTVDHMVLLNQAYENAGQAPRWTQYQIDEWREKSKTDPIGYPNTDWWDAIIKSNLIMNHNLSATGGSDKIKFFTSLGYYSNDGLIPNTAYERINFRNNLTYSVNEWLELGNILTITTSKQDPADEGRIFSWWHFTTPGAVPKYDGRYGGGQTYDVELEANNGLWYTERWHGENLRNSYTQKIFATLKPYKGFSITGEYYTTVENAEGWSSPENTPWWNFRTGEPTRTFSTRKSISTYNNKSQRHIYDVFANYHTLISNHEIGLLIGFNQEHYKYNNINASKQDLLSFDTPVLDAAPSDPMASGGANEFATRSYFGRLNYNYLGKYLFESNLRYDGSSRFSPDNRWGVFPSFSGGWVISEEPFWSSISDVINVLKFRTSWGKLGNSGIGNYEWQSLYSPANHNFAGSVVQGLRYNSIANSSITWETTDVLNFGIDMVLFKNLILDINYYNKYTNNILARNPIPFVWGGIAPPRTNAAEVSNKGFEADIRYSGNISDLSYSISVNGSYNKNKIESYKGDYIEPQGNGAWTEGYPIGIFWLRQIDHIVQDKSEIDALVADGWTFNPSTPGEGDFLYKDANGDKRIDNNDRILQGNPIPLINYGGSLSLKYKGIDFYMLINGVAKWDKYLYSDIYSVTRMPSRLAAKSLLNAWTPENRSTDIPKLYFGDTRNNQSSDFYLHDASFLRIKTLQLGYTLPTHVIKQLGEIRIYANLENFFTFTSFPGPDPESEERAFNSSSPIIKTMSIGLNVNF
jgi:TonB-linked SusC/RagA family outer membrane protein